MAKDYKKDMENKQELDLNKDEVIFFYALVENDSAVRELCDDSLKSPWRSP